jgi:type VI secretion system secreted protein VgrG
MPIIQEERPYEILVPHLGKDKFVFLSMDGAEYVSKPFEYTIVAATEEKEIDDEDLLRKPVLVTLRRDSFPPRLLHGVIRKAKLLGVEEGLTTIYHWQIVVVPALWFLNLDQDCRHFINKTALDIVKEILAEEKIKFIVKNVGALPKREFTVQYRESTFNFISRLLEEEGIFYWFEHTDSAHTMMLADTNQATRNCPHVYKLPFARGTSNRSMGLIDTLEQETSVHTGKITLQDYNFEKSGVSLQASSKGAQLNEFYEYPGRYSTKQDGERFVKLRLEEQEARLRTIQSHTISTMLLAGFRFQIEDHFEAKANTTYVVLGISFACQQNLSGTEGEDGTTASFYFSAIPFQVPYRPPLIHPKPIIHGVQTAVVVGPAGNEIHCDRFGRVKIQFHWDRKSKKDDNSSWWVRVSSSWAGGNWGQISIPRIGQEVIVSFLEGDPDRPIIVGRVYNDQQMPPYSLPDNKTQSGIKSRSSTGGGGSDFNEFRFEDKKGSEEIYLHAQKDFNVVVENKQTVTVQKSDQITTIESGNRSITVSKGNNSLEATAGKIAEKAAQEIKMECGGSKIILTPASIKLEIGGSKIEMLPAMITIKAPMIMQN